MRRSVAAALVAGVVWAGCAELATLRIDDASQTSIKGASLFEQLVGNLGFGGFLNMDITDHRELRNQGVQPGDLKSVRLELLELEVLSPDGGDLSFIDSIAFHVEAPGLPSQRIAFSDEFPEGVAVVSLELDDVDLVDYAVSEAMTFTTEVSGRRPGEDTVVEGRFELAITATVQGACNAIRGDKEG